jgi:hypothetical protein
MYNYLIYEDKFIFLDFLIECILQDFFYQNFYQKKKTFPTLQVTGYGYYHVYL